MSEFTEKKAQNIIDTKSIQIMDSGTYKIQSSTPGESYVIESGFMQCQCKGFLYRDDCSHIQAVKMMQQIQREAIIAKVKNYSKKQTHQRCKTLFANLKKSGWNSNEEYEKWSSHVISWREELAILGNMMKQ